MSRKPLSLLGSAALALVGISALTGCGVSPAYTPVRTAVIAEPMAVETAPAPAQPVEQAAYDDTDPAALTDFHETLAPYGSWEEDAAYGTVWVPAAERVGADFAPYKTAGHWELDQNEEWLWVSDYDDSFGWVVFHYGRWAHTEARGWVWIPGRRYAPAWVAWQTGDPGYGYIGWAAMPPAYYWHSGAVVWLDVYPTPYYVYCPTSYVFYRNWHTYAVPRHHVVAVATPMRPYGTPRGGGRVYAQPHRGPNAGSGVVPPASYPTSRHAMADGHRRYAVPSSGASAGNGLGGSPRAGSRSRSQSYDLPGGPERGPGRPSGGDGGRPSFAGSPDGGASRSSSAFAGSSAGRGVPPVAAPPGRSSSAFDSRTPSSAPPVGRVSGDGPTRSPSAFAPSQAPPGAVVARPSAPSAVGPAAMPSRPSAFGARSAPPPAPVSAPSRAPSSFSAPSRSPSPSSFSAPSRSPSPSSFSAPSRASSPSVSSPSRSSSSGSSRPSAPSGGSRGRR